METNYLKKTVTVFDDISGRTAIKLSQASFQYDKNSIFIQKHGEDNRRVSAKSLLGILSLGIRKTDKVDVLISNDNSKGVNILAHLLTVIGGVE